MSFFKTYINIWNISNQYYKKSKYHLFLFSIIIAFSSLLTSLLPYLMKLIIDSANDKTILSKVSDLLSTHTLYLLVIIYAITWLSSQILDWTKNIFSSYINSSLESSIIFHSLNSYLTTTKRNQDKIDIADYNSDVDRASNAFTVLTMTVFFVFLPVLIQLVSMSYILSKNINISFSIFFILFALLIFIISNRINKNSRKYFEPLYKSRNILNSFFIEKIQNSNDIKANHSYNYEEHKFKKNIENFVNQTFTSNYKIGILMILQIIFIFLYLISFLLFSVLLFNQNKISAGDFVMIGSYILLLTTPFLMISQQIMLINGHLVSIEKIFKYFNLEKDIFSNEVFLDNDCLFEFRNCKVLIGNDSLENFNLKIYKNKVYAITGKTGIGKSTLINHLLGIYKVESGTLFYKTLNITKSYSKIIFNEVAFVGQTASIYNGTLRENLVYNSEVNYEDEYLYKLLDKFDLHTILIKNKLSLDSDINELHKSFSGGEKQRLNILRAVLKKPKVLILDEPTSALDQSTATKIMHYLKENIESIIFITHSAYFIKFADDIINMDEFKKNEV